MKAVFLPPEQSMLYCFFGEVGTVKTCDEKRLVLMLSHCISIHTTWDRVEIVEGVKK